MSFFFVEGRDPCLPLASTYSFFYFFLQVASLIATFPSSGVHVFILFFLFFSKDASLIATLPSSGVDVYGVFDGHGPVGEQVSRCVYCSSSTRGREKKRVKKKCHGVSTVLVVVVVPMLPLVLG